MAAACQCLKLVTWQKCRWARGELRFLVCGKNIQWQRPVTGAYAAAFKTPSVPPTASSKVLLQFHGCFLGALFRQLSKVISHYLLSLPITQISVPPPSTLLLLCSLSWAPLSPLLDTTPMQSPSQPGSATTSASCHLSYAFMLFLLRWDQIILPLSAMPYRTLRETSLQELTSV